MLKSFIVDYTGVARGVQGEVPTPHPTPNPGKFAKDGEQPRSQPAVSLDSRSKFKFLLIFF